MAKYKPEVGETYYIPCLIEFYKEWLKEEVSNEWIKTMIND